MRTDGAIDLRPASPGLIECTIFYIFTCQIMRVIPHPLALCADPKCGCTSRCVAHDELVRLSGNRHQ